MLYEFKDLKVGDLFVDARDKDNRDAHVYMVVQDDRTSNIGFVDFDMGVLTTNPNPIWRVFSIEGPVELPDA